MYKSLFINKKKILLESELEKATLDALRKRGALCYKFVSPSRRGVPDDMVLLPDGVCVFVEFKRPYSGVLSQLQKNKIAQLQEQGFEVWVVGSLEDADKFIQRCIDIMVA